MSKTLDFNDCFVIVFEPADALSLHKSINRLDIIPPVIAHLKDLLNDYTGLDNVIN